jgi:hypothetical protein
MPGVPNRSKIYTTLAVSDVHAVLHVPQKNKMYVYTAEIMETLFCFLDEKKFISVHFVHFSDEKQVSIYTLPI